MATKSRQDELIKFDSRMIEYNLANGLITKEEYDKYLAQLPDLSTQSVAFTMDDSASGADDEAH